MLISSPGLESGWGIGQDIFMRNLSNVLQKVGGFAKEPVKPVMGFD